MKYKSIKAFGCSCTYGHSLPDCFEKPHFPGLAPSNFAWPALVAQHMNLPWINFGICGGSPKQVTYTLMHTPIESDDLVLILWPQHIRTCFITDNKVGTPRHSPDLGEYNFEMQIIGPWVEEKTRFYEQFHYENDAVFNFSIYTQMVYLHLASKGVHQIHRYYYYTPQLPFWNTVDLGKFPFDDITAKHDRAADGHHPGLLAHREFADEFIMQISANGWL